MSTLLHDHPEALGQIETLSDVARYLREHQHGHAEWVVWLEKHPEDVNAGVGSIEYQRQAVARYERLIGVVEKGAADNTTLQTALRRTVAALADAESEMRDLWYDHPVREENRAARAQATDILAGTQP